MGQLFHIQLHRFDVGLYCVWLCSNLIIIIQAINQIFLLSALFSDIKLAGEMQSFLSIAVNFFVYFTFVKAVAETEAYYIFLTILSPQCGASFSYVTSMKKEEGDIDLLKINLFPIDIINDTFSVESAGIVLSILILAYFLLFLYCE